MHSSSSSSGAYFLRIKAKSQEPNYPQTHGQYRNQGIPYAHWGKVKKFVLHFSASIWKQVYSTLIFFIHQFHQSGKFNFNSNPNTSSRSCILFLQTYNSFIFASSRKKSYCESPKHTFFLFSEWPKIFFQNLPFFKMAKNASIFFAPSAREKIFQDDFAQLKRVSSYRLSSQKCR